MRTHDLMDHPYKQLTKEQIAQSLKVHAARLNALKSTGPRTPEGKAISARNAFKHGFAAVKLVIDKTEEDAFNDHMDAYFLRFRPQDQVEADVVRRIAEAQWKMDIINATENTIMSIESGYQMSLVDAKLDPEQITINYYRAFAIVEQSDGHALDLCHRYYVSASREYNRSLKTFYKLREERSDDAAQPLVPELLPAPPPVAIDDGNSQDAGPNEITKPNEPKAPLSRTPKRSSIIEFPNEPNPVADPPDDKRAA